MDKSDHKLEVAAGCTKNTDDSKISMATNKISLNNKNNLEVDEIVVYNPDDWIDYDYNKVDDSQAFVPNNPPIAEAVKKPVKNNMPCSDIQTSESPKSKKRKLPNFEELLENLDYNILYMNLTKLLQFLESDHKDMCFPFELKDYGEFFKMIVRNISLLKSKCLDAHYRDICDKIAEALDFKKTGFLLTYVYECRQGFQNTVLVIKKAYVMLKLEDETPLSPCSFSTMRSSESSSDMDTKTQSRSPSPATISNDFKVHCLRTALAFIKNDVTNTKEFPELSTEQASFMQLLLDSVVAFADFDSSLETKELYRALWEAVRIYNLKYEFRIKCVETFGDKKNLVFEKLPKMKPAQKGGNLEQPAPNSHPIMNLSSGVPTPEAIMPGASKPESPKASKPKATNPEAQEPQATNPEATMPGASKPEALQPVASKPEATIPVESKPEATMPVASKPEAITPVASKPDVPKPQPLQLYVPEPMFRKPQIPKRAYPKLTKKMRKQQSRIDKEQFFIKQMPTKFVSDTLHSILAFLTDPIRIEMVFVPSIPSEREFYRKCIGWCRNCNVNRFAPEFHQLQFEILALLKHIDCQVKKPSACKVNKATGMKEVVYVKPSSWKRPLYVPHSIQSAPKNRKVNLKNALQMAATTANTQLSSIVNLNQSFRHKKKNKKARKAKINCHNPGGVSSGTSSSRTMSLSEGFSSDTGSERGSSWDRSKVPAKAQRLTINTTEEDSQRVRDIAEAERVRLRRHTAFRISDVTRKKQLKEALSVPVKSDKAMKMMRGMGWSGGALGARGNGITVPLMPSLDIARGAGFGHNRAALPVTIPKIPKKPVTGPCFVNEIDTPSVTEISENDIIVQKTRQILFENMTLDSILKMIELRESSISNVKLPEATISNIELSTPTTLNNELPISTTANIELPEPTTSNAEHSKLTTSNVELPKSTSNVELPRPTSNAEFSKPITTNIELPKPTTSNVELPKPTTSNAELPTPNKSDIEHPDPTSNIDHPQGDINKFHKPSKFKIFDSSQSFRQKILNGVLELLSGIETCKSLDYCFIRQKDKIFLHNAIHALNSIEAYRRGLFHKEEQGIYNQIRDKFREQQNVFIKAFVFNHLKKIDLRKIIITNSVRQLASSVPSEPGTISCEKLEEYIASFGSSSVSQKAYEFIKFRVLFLLNMQNVAKSTNLEWEVNFDKCLIPKQRAYIEQTIEEINMRVKYGSTPAEVELCEKINTHIKDAFLGVMFGHRYRSVTIDKYYRFKRLNKPDGDKRVWETTFNITDFSSETKLSEFQNNVETKPITIVITDSETDSSDDHITTDEPIDKSIDLSDNNSSAEDYNEDNATAKVPNLPPGEEGVNLSNFLPLYEKTNSADITENSSKNDTNSKIDSNMSDNINNKNNSSNGNVFIDDNDNQVIDMKRDAQIDVIMTGKDNIPETEVSEYVMCVDYVEEVIEKADNENNNTNIVVAQNGGNNAKIDNDDDIKMIDEVPINAKDLVEDVIIEDSGSKNDGGENTVRAGKENIKDKKVENVINKEIDTNDPKVKELMDGSGKEELVEAAIKGVSIEVTKKDESKRVTNRRDLTKVTNKRVALKVTDKGKSIEVTNKREALDVTNKGTSMRVTNRGESLKDANIAQIKEKISINTSDSQKIKENANLEPKTNCDIVSKIEVGLRQGNCDTQSVDLEAAGTVVVDSTAKVTQEVKSVIIKHLKHPGRKLTKGKVFDIQNQISESIKKTKPTQLPLLMCHGFENGKLTYTCHNKNSYEWLHNTISLLGQVKMSNITVSKMALTFYCFTDLDVTYLFKMIELYNRELSTKYWVVEKTEEHADYVVFIIKMDKFSVNFIQTSGLALFAGVDKVEFSPVWD